MQVAISVVQIVLSLVVTALVLVQMRNAGLGGVFGGGDVGVQHTRRGVDKLLFNLTIVAAIIFGLVSLLSVLLGTPAGG